MVNSVAFTVYLNYRQYLRLFFSFTILLLCVVYKVIFSLLFAQFLCLQNKNCCGIKETTLPITITQTIPFPILMTLAANRDVLKRCNIYFFCVQQHPGDEGVAQRWLPEEAQHQAGLHVCLREGVGVRSGRPAVRQTPVSQDDSLVQCGSNGVHVPLV